MSFNALRSIRVAGQCSVLQRSVEVTPVMAYHNGLIPTTKRAAVVQIEIVTGCCCFALYCLYCYPEFCRRVEWDVGNALGIAARLSTVLAQAPFFEQSARSEEKDLAHLVAKATPR